MSRITKKLANITAEKLMKPKQKEIDDIKSDLKKLLTTEYESKLPDDVKKLFKDKPEWFDTTTNIRIQGSGFDRWNSFYFTKELPKKTDYFIVDDIFGGKIIDLDRKLESLRLEYRKLKQEIEIALLGLVTYKKVESEFPEAFKLLPPITTTALTVDLKSIRCKIDKKNC